MIAKIRKSVLQFQGYFQSLAIKLLHEARLQSVGLSDSHTFLLNSYQPNATAHWQQYQDSKFLIEFVIRQKDIFCSFSRFTTSAHQELKSRENLFVECRAERVLRQNSSRQSCFLVVGENQRLILQCLVIFKQYFKDNIVLSECEFLGWSKVGLLKKGSNCETRSTFSYFRSSVIDLFQPRAVSPDTR